jgi:hypothetical protein
MFNDFYSFEKLSISPITINDTSCKVSQKQSCQQATFFRLGLACQLYWPSLIQPAGQAKKSKSVLSPVLQEKSGQLMFLIF